MHVQLVGRLDSDLVTPHKETPCAAQQGVGSGDNGFPSKVNVD